ncbi:5-hydroxytryptamine receptor 3A-like [Anguilla rostrata]|uniref:5-hydroxytryptamine receptor 3A-like n=1 Tax=Anguilla rostrata TaxID=7938 RepID=UPI0030CCEFD0
MKQDHQLLMAVEGSSIPQPDAKSLLTGINNILVSKEIRPVVSLNSPTTVSTSFVLYGILDVEWYIENFSWDSSQCGTERISLPREKLWVPDILINEFMDEDRSPNAPFIYLLNDGHVIDTRPVRVVSSCNLDIYTFPFDVQNCSLTFNSFMLMAADLQLKLGAEAEETLEMSRMALETVGEWELIDITADDTIDEISYELFDEVIYYIILRRRPTMYVVNLLVPSCFLITVDLFSFLLPPQTVDRSSFKMTLILGYTVFLLIMNDLLPITGNRIPLINVFFSICLALMVCSLLETVLITNILCNSSQYPSVPRWIRVIVLQYLARLVCLDHSVMLTSVFLLFPAASVENMEAKPGPNVTAEPQSDDLVLGQLKRLGQDVLAIRQQVEKHLADNETAEDWIQIGNVIDRLLFYLYIFFIIVSFITISVIWIKWYSL